MSPSSHEQKTSRWQGVASWLWHFHDPMISLGKVTLHWMPTSWHQNWYKTLQKPYKNHGSICINLRPKIPWIFILSYPIQKWRRSRSSKFLKCHQHVMAFFWRGTAICGPLHSCHFTSDISGLSHLSQRRCEKCWNFRMKQEKTIDKHITYVYIYMCIQQITKMIKHWESWWSYS